MKVRSLYHNPKGERGVGKAIVAWTWLLGLFYNWKVLKYNFSHEEIWLPDLSNDFDTVDYGGFFEHLWCGQCFSSTTRGNANGVRFAPASEVLKHPERWSYIEFEITQDQYDDFLLQAEFFEGQKYDYGYVLSFLQPFVIQRDTKWACSEICNWFKHNWNIVKKFLRISPRRSAYELAKVWGEPIALKGN